MAPKGNPKAVAAREAKAGREADKKGKEAAAKDAQEEEEWGKGAKKEKGQDKAAKAAAARDAKAARDAALAEEEAALASAKKAAPKAGAKKPAKIATPAKSSPGGTGPGTPAQAESSGGIPSFEDAMNANPESFSASNLDDALSLLSLVNEKQDKASLGSKAATSLDAHPERRYKAAFAAYKERELPELRKSHPGLRLQQYEELMFKDFKKSPENPFNQATVAFDATKEEKLEALKKLRAETENRLREKK